MAVIQISKIQVRRGLEEDLPQLAAGEFGWATDTRRLFIGNGITSSPDYAPEIGNTEILTVFAADAMEIRVDNLEANVTVLQSQVTSLQANAALGSITLLNDTTANTSLSFGNVTSHSIDYNIVRGTDIRTGTINLTSVNGIATFQDEYSENAGTGVVLTFVTNDSNASNVTLQYTTSDISLDATFNYYIKSFV